MKKLTAMFVFLMVVFLFAASTMQAAIPLQFSFGKLKINVPLQNVSVVYLYDFVNDENLLGGETSVVEFKSLRGTVGAVTDIDGLGTPFFGLDYNLPDTFFGKRLRFGAFLGYNFNTEEKQAGIKSSVLLW